MTSVFQGLSLSRSVVRVGENPGNEVACLSHWLAHEVPLASHSQQLIVTFLVNQGNLVHKYGFLSLESETANVTQLNNL